MKRGRPRQDVFRPAPDRGWDVLRTAVSGIEAEARALERHACLALVEWQINASRSLGESTGPLELLRNAIIKRGEPHA